MAQLTLLFWEIKQDISSAHQIIVTEYIDKATGIMEETKDRSGKFTEVIPFEF